MGRNCLITLVFVGLMIGGEAVAARPNYADALTKSIMFFEGQRSGRLPSSQRVRWRNDSALHDGLDIRVDLAGGYYDAGDNVKFHFPMAFTTTMLAWSVLEFGNLMGLDLKHALGSVRWGTDYFLKATGVPGAVVAQVGEPISDHDCWERPEDMDTLRTSYVVNRTHPGSEVSAEIAAALAATSIIFKTSDRKYSNKLLQRAEEVFNFADSHQGAYSGACPFYCDGNGYQDELIWGAAWLFKATNNPKYWNYVVEKMKSLGGSCAEFGWDAKHAGINILVAPLVMHTAKSDPFIPNADTFVCSILPNSPTKSVTYSPGGLLFKPGGSNLQHATALSFLLLVYSRYLHSARRMVHCGNVVAASTALVHIAKSQVDYILGKNPLGMSYMVGYGKKFPKRIHHRGSSLPSVSAHEQRMGCRDGDHFLYREEPNINLLVGAIVGGPDCNDQYIDNRLNVSQSEPATYINGPFVGVSAYFKGQKKQ